MVSYRTVFRPTGRDVVKRLLLAFALLWPVVLAAEDDLYTASVTVPDQSSAAREEGLRRALSEVLVRVSGDADVNRKPTSQEVLSRAAELMQQYGYRREPAESEDEPDTIRLEARFDPHAVNRALREAGLPVWGRERPATIAWIAMDGRDGARIVGRDAPLSDVIGREARERGIEVVLPDRDDAERRRLTAADILGGYDERLRAVSRGYAPDHLLIGRLRASARGWLGEWTLAHRGETLASWQESGSRPADVVAGAVGYAADVYARRLAVSGANGVSEAVVAVDGLDEAADYARTERYLSGLTPVSDVTLRAIEGGTAVFSVELAASPQVLERTLALADWLTTDRPARNLASVYAGEGAVAGYRLTGPP